MLDSSLQKPSKLNENTTNQYDADVIIVGAGPIGLTTACALRHHGVDLRIFEKRTQPKPNSRANNMWARPQELMNSIGLRKPIAEQAYRVEKFTVLLDGKPMDQVRVDEADTPFPMVLFSGQDIIEKTLSEQLQSRGATLERGRKVTAISQDESGVNLTVQPVSEEGEVTGPGEQLRCRYLIGADGVEGTVRKTLGLDYDTMDFPGRSNRQLDAKLSWQRSTKHDQMWFFAYHHGFAGVLPVWEGYHRFFILEEEDSSLPDREPTLEEMQERAREITGDTTLTFTDPIWFSHTKFEHAVSPHYAKGRVFLAGDAGHYTLPIGGQGMNAGFHDAVGIAWRLAMTLSGVGSPAILDSYDAERQNEHESLDTKQAKGFERLEYRSAFGDWAMSAVGKVVPDLGERLFGSADLHQLSVSYPNSPLTEEGFGTLSNLGFSGPQAGDRAPDAAVVDHEGNIVQLFSLIYGGDFGAAPQPSWSWTLLAFDGHDAEVKPTLQSALEVTKSYDFLRVRFILAAPALASGEAGMERSLADLDELAHKAYGLNGTPALVLIRPDGHIALRVPAAEVDRLVDYCKVMFSKAKGATP